MLMWSNLASSAADRYVPLVSTRPLILLSNDDGYRAQGLQSVAAALRREADVVVCAPETEQSTTSHSLTLTRPLRLRQVEPSLYAVDGTPADCVYVALNAGTRVLPRTPDLVVSGMNHGLNLGTDVFYSGTVAAAREGALRGVPAMAVSADPDADPDASAALAARLATADHRSPGSPTATSRRRFPELRFGGDRVPGVSADAGAAPQREFSEGLGWPVMPTVLGLRLYDDLVEFRRDPRGREYLWIGGGGVHHEEMLGSDTDAYDRGIVSITPLLLDLTSMARGD